jgi:hypothetical protein
MTPARFQVHRRSTALRRTGRVHQRLDPAGGRRRQSPWWLIAAPLAVLSWLLFLRGPNGLLQMTNRWRRIRASDAELAAMKNQVDSLESLRALLSDTGFVRSYAAGLLGTDSTPVDDGRP